MRMLFLTSRLPAPPDRGDRVRVSNFLKHLADEHEITLVSFIADEAERANLDHLQDCCRGGIHVVCQTRLQSVLSVAKEAWRKTPLQVAYYHSRAMRRVVASLASTVRFDAVYVHLFRMAPYAADLRGTFRILDLTDVISMELSASLAFRDPISRRVYALEAARIEQYERVLPGLFDEVWLVSERDRQELSRRIGGDSDRLQVVPIGVEPDRFHPLEIEGRKPCLLFVGNMSVLHNVDAAGHLASDILPLVLEGEPDAGLRLVGADPVPRVLKLGRHRRVTVSGFVTDLNRALNEATVFVAPLRFAAGQQNKVLEAMAAGRAVVTTTIVNDGIRAVAGRDLLVADDPVGFAAQVLALIGDPESRRRIGANARRFVTENFRWDAVADRVSAIQETVRAGTR
jgi:sugar transferase (PEP-CTERM/EpsH1 system associated)